MITKQFGFKKLLSNWSNTHQQLAARNSIQKKNTFQILNKYSFCSSQVSAVSDEARSAVQWQIKQLNSTKNKEKFFQNEIINKLNNLDSSIIADILNCMQEHSLTKLSLINLLKNQAFSSYTMNDLEIQFIQKLFKNSANPKKLDEFVEIMQFLMESENEQFAKIYNSLDIHSFQKEFNRIIIEHKEDVELNQVIEWIKTFQALDHSIEMNGIINEKAFDELYDYSAKEWLEILSVYRINGKVDIELLKEMDKVVSKDKELLYSDYQLFCKYIQLCSVKDFKPAQIEEYKQHLKEITLAHKKIMAPLYLESIQYFHKEYVQDIFNQLLKITSAEEIGMNLHSKDILRLYGVLPENHQELQEIINKKNNHSLYKFIKQRVELAQKEHAFQIEELFMITKYIFDTQMMKRNSDARKLNLPHIISEEEQMIIIEMLPIVNNFMKEKAYKKANSLKQFLEVSSISFFMGFLKQQKECYDAISPQYLKQFQSLYMFPLIVEFGKNNTQLLFNLMPVYSEYLNNKYIPRNQLTFEEATQFMKTLHQIKDIYIEQNAKYHYKEFVYAIKTVSRLIINTFQMRIYSNYKDIKSNKKQYENFFMEQKDTKWQTEKEKIEIATDLTKAELDQLLQVFYLANDMNIGSKEFYDSMEELIIQYYDSFTLSQKALSAYILSTLEAQNEKIEQKIEQTILSTSSFTLEQAVQFLPYLTARYILNEDVWKKLISVVQKHDQEGTLIQNISQEQKLNLYLTRECLLLEQPHILFPMSQKSVEHLAAVFTENQLTLANRETAFTEAIKYFLDRMGYYYETNQKAAIFIHQFSKLDEKNLVLIYDKWSFIGDTKTQRSFNSIMVRILTKKNLKLKIFNVYDWAGKEKRSEKIAYLRSKVKGMSYDGEKQKKKTYFNF